MKTESLSKKSVLDFLQSHQSCCVATVTDKNKPDASYVYYAVRENFDIYFLTKSGTDKYKNLKKKKDVTLVVVDQESFHIAKIKGVVSLISDSTSVLSMINEIAQLLNGKEEFYKRLAPFIERDAGLLALVKVSPVQIRMSVYGKKKLEEITLELHKKMKT